MPPLPPYQIQYHPQDHNLLPWHSHPYILPLVVVPQEESPPLRRPRRSNVWRRGNNHTYVRPGHYHPYAPPQQRHYSYVEDGDCDVSELEDVEQQFYYIPGEADVGIEIEFGTDFDLTLYGCTPGAEAEVGITYLPPVDAPEDDDDAELEDCPICLDEMRPEDRVNPTAELPCGHSFHADCIMKWLCGGDHNTCPICRYELPPDDE